MAEDTSDEKRKSDIDFGTRVMIHMARMRGEDPDEWEIRRKQTDIVNTCAKYKKMSERV